jgi:beta-N-acetylhexosaminidase
LLVGFFYWFFVIERPPTEEIPPKEEIVEEPEIQIPTPLISVEKTIILEVSKIEDIPEIFSQVWSQEWPENSFAQIVIKNISEKKLVALKETLESFGVWFPADIFEKKEGDVTLAAYFQKEGKRIVAVSKIKEREVLNELLETWEEKITEEGIFLSGQKVLSVVSPFKTSTFQNVSFRYLTISEEDLGICYALFNDHFVFTTSFTSMQKIIDELAIKEVAPLTLEEKAGQLFIVGFKGTTVTPEIEAFFKKYKPGGVLLLSKNIESVAQLKKLTSDLQALSLREAGFPLFIAVDQEGEPMSRIDFLQEKTGQSEIENIEMAFRVGKTRGEELKELGVNLNLAPVLDDMKEGDFYFNRTFKKSPQVAGELSKSLILGQKESGILIAVKHFPGYVNIPFNPESRLATVNLPEILQFKKAMEAKPEIVMASNVIYEEIDPSLPLTFSRQGIQFLKDNLGQEPLIISDDLAQNSLLENFSLKEIVTRPIKAGVDILIFSGWRSPVEEGLNTFLEAVRNKEISETELENTISKITQLKQNLLK